MDRYHANKQPAFPALKENSTRMWNSRPWELRPAVNVFLNPCSWFQSNPEFNFFLAVSLNANKNVSLLLLLLYSCISTHFFPPLLQSLVIRQTKSVHCPPAASSSNLIISHLEVGGSPDSNAEYFYTNLKVLHQPWTSVEFGSEILSPLLYDYRIGRQFTTAELNATGSDRTAAENLSVLFLARSHGPWYRWALEWRQDSDLENSSGFCGTGSAPFIRNVMCASKDEDQKEAATASAIELHSW